MTTTSIKESISTSVKESVSSQLTSRSFCRLYLYRFLGTWGDRQWWFGCGIFIFQFHNTDLSYNAYLGLAQCLTQVFLGPWLGKWIDDTDRMRAVKIFVFMQNICITIGCSVVALFFWDDEVEYDNRLFAGIIIGFAVLAQLAALGDQIVVQRDWVVQISSTKDELVRLNTIFQTIDLACKTMAPIFVGLVIDLTSITTTAIAIAGWNIISAFLEYILILMIFKDYPTLLKPKRDPKESRRTSGLLAKVRDSFQGWKLYMTHPTRNAGLCLALLYMSVLAFGNVLWAYSLLQCVREYFLAILVGAAAINGLLGSSSFPCLRRRFGLECTGQLGLLLLWTGLGACVASVFLPGSPWGMLSQIIKTKDEDPDTCPTKISIYVLLGGVVAGRFGLWLTDIVITQIQQENVEEQSRGKIGGVQGALNSTLELIKFALVLIFPVAEDFGYLVFASYFAVSCGAFLYTTYAKCGCRRSSSFVRQTDVAEGEFDTRLLSASTL